MRIPPTVPVDARSRLVSLDLLRFVAAASVMIYHYTYHLATADRPALSALETVTRHGYLGVEVFFIISGFVILWSAKGRTATSFVRARVLRLYPEFWLAVLVAAAVFLLAPGPFGDPTSAGQVLANLTMVPSLFGAPYVDGVYWTLFAELKFYAIVWFLLLLRQERAIERWMLAWLAVLLLDRFVALPGVVRSLVIYPYGQLFAVGGIFYLVFDSGWTRTRVLALAAGLALAADAAVKDMTGFIAPSHITEVARASTVAVLVATFVYFATLRTHRLDGPIARVAPLLGALTYPLYLLHNSGKALFLGSGTAGPGWLRIAAATAFSLLIAYGVMRLGTGPVHRLLRSGIDAGLARFARMAGPAT